MPNYKKICMNCQKELPLDSVFCQFCGSRDIKTKELEEEQVKICRSCGKKLPYDSKFCQYCGSNDLDDNISTINQIKCSNCGKLNPADSAFCQYCGNDLSIGIKEKKQIKRCRSCGKEIPIESSFCLFCGSNDIVLESVLYNTNEKRNNDSTNKNKKERKNLWKYVLLAFTVILLLVIALIFFKRPKQNNLVPISFENGEIVSSFKMDGVSGHYNSTNVIAFNNKTDDNVMVFIKNKYDENMHCAFLIQKNNKYNFWIPEGVYAVYYAVGDSWYGKDLLFGEETSFYCENYAIDVKYVQYEGNYTTRDIVPTYLKSISKEGFPSFSSEANHEAVEEVDPIDIQTGMVISYNGLDGSKGSENIAGLRFVNNTGSNALIYIREPRRIDYACFVVKENEEWTWYLPLDNYEVFFATGEYWYGKETLFGKGTDYYSIDYFYSLGEDGNKFTLALNRRDGQGYAEVLKVNKTDSFQIKLINEKTRKTGSYEFPSKLD